MNSFQKWKKEWVKELNWWFSEDGRELQYCLVAQGYEDRLFNKFMLLFGSGFTAIKIIKEIRGEVD